jgi:hypothetical protein
MKIVLPHELERGTIAGTSSGNQFPATPSAFEAPSQVVRQISTLGSLLSAEGDKASPFSVYDMDPSDPVVYLITRTMAEIMLPGFGNICCCHAIEIWGREKGPWKLVDAELMATRRVFEIDTQQSHILRILGGLIPSILREGYMFLWLHCRIFWLHLRGMIHAVMRHQEALLCFNQCIAENAVLTAPEDGGESKTAEQWVAWASQICLGCISRGAE